MKLRNASDGLDECLRGIRVNRMFTTLAIGQEHLLSSLAGLDSGIPNWGIPSLTPGFAKFLGIPARKIVDTDSCPRLHQKTIWTYMAWPR